jgi:hypothetical protein
MLKTPFNDNNLALQQQFLIFRFKILQLETGSDM